MNNLRFGDVIYFVPISGKGKIISSVERGNWSHVGFILTEHQGQVLFMESDWNGVRVRVLKHDFDNFEIWRPDTIPMRTPFEAMEEVGKFYDYKHLFWTGISKLTRGRFKIPKTDNKKYICSEFVNWLYGYRLMKQGTATPNLLYERKEGECLC